MTAEKKGLIKLSTINIHVGLNHQKHHTTACKSQFKQACGQRHLDFHSNSATVHMQPVAITWVDLLTIWRLSTYTDNTKTLHIVCVQAPKDGSELFWKGMLNYHYTDRQTHTCTSLSGTWTHSGNTFTEKTVMSFLCLKAQTKAGVTNLTEAESYFLGTD